MRNIKTGEAIFNETFGQTNSADIYMYNNNSECSKKQFRIKYSMALSLMMYL